MGGGGERIITPLDRYSEELQDARGTDNSSLEGQVSPPQGHVSKPRSEVQPGAGLGTGSQAGGGDVRWGFYANAAQAEEIPSAKFQRHQGAWLNRLRERTPNEQSLNVKRRHWKDKWDSRP